MVSKWFLVGLARRIITGFGRMGRDLMRRYFRGSQLGLETGVGDPYQQSWIDSGGQQMLWRLRVRNLSPVEPRRRVQVKISHIDPWAMHGIPVFLQVRNRPGVSEFALSPGDDEYVDVIQQTMPNGLLLLWHTISHLGHTIPKQPYKLTITASSDDSGPCVRKYRIDVENGVCFLRPDPEEPK